MSGKRDGNSRQSNSRLGGGKQGGGKQVAAARRGSGRAGTIAGVLVVVVIAAAVTIGVLVSKHRTSTAAAVEIPVAPTAGVLSVPVSLDEKTGTVLVGKSSAKVTVDAYEDFLCPNCGKFEQLYGADIHSKLAAGTVKVRYHMLNLLDDHSDPPGYSLLAANAALTVAKLDPAKFVDFHDSLYGSQPAEGSPGYDADQLTKLATKLGVTDPKLAGMVRGMPFRAVIQQDLATSSKDPSLRSPQPDGSLAFGTPTVTSGGKLIDPGDPHWLDKLVRGASA